MSITITDIKAQEILSNIGTATVRVYVCANNEHWGVADMPLGICNCDSEARVILDGEKRLRGSGVRTAVANVTDTIRPALLGVDASDQTKIDQLLIDLDGTKGKSNLGGNTTYPTSVATAKAVAKAKGLPLYGHINTSACILPVPWISLIVGGWQGANDMDVQDISLMPTTATSFAEAMEFSVEVFYSLKEVLGEKYGPLATSFTGDGGFTSPVGPTTEVLDILLEGLKRASCEGLGAFHIDVAASNFFDREKGIYQFEGKKRTGEEMVEYAVAVSKDYPQVKVWEDVVEQNDFANFQNLIQKLPNHMILGDDIFGTDLTRIKKGFEMGAANAAICKIDQPGTLTEALEAAKYTTTQGTLVMSVRAVETEDNSICDVSVALGAPHLKMAGIQGSERSTKFNRLFEIENELGTEGVYAGNAIDFENLALKNN
jgi:enolase